MECIGGRSGLTDNLHVPLEADQVRETPSDDLVIVHEEDADGAIGLGRGHHGVILHYRRGVGWNTPNAQRPSGIR